MELGQRLKQARLEAGLSQRQLCGDAITRNMLSQIENGSARPSMDTLQYLASRLGKPVSYFLEEAVASPNQTLMCDAREAFARNDFPAARQLLAQYQKPDPICDMEYDYLFALIHILLAEQEYDPQKTRQLLSSAADAGAQTPYYTADLERRRLLRLSQLQGEDPNLIAESLPHDDRELLLRSAAALEQKDPDRAAICLQAAQDHTTPQWLILRADAALMAGDTATAERYYRQAEAHAPDQVWAKLEQLYLQQENYKMAYLYACKQRP